MAKNKHTPGLISIPKGVFVSIHEKITADFLSVKGFDVTFIPPNRSINTKTPDVEMLGEKWEIKSPTGKSKRTIENNLRLALRQSPNIILDLRRIDSRIPTQKHLNYINYRYSVTKKIRHILVITKELKLIDYNR